MQGGLMLCGSMKASLIYSHQIESNAFDILKKLCSIPNTTVKHKSGNVVIWNCFSFNELGSLVIIDGNMNQFMYVDILKTYMPPYVKQNLPARWYFQQDNDPKYKSKYESDFMKRRKVNVLQWACQSPDLDPLQHLWEGLGRTVRCENIF